LRYPVIQRPLPPGLTTLREYAPRVGRTPEYLEIRWRKLEGFPAPLYELPSAARNGGGQGELVYSETALDAFRELHPSLWGHRSVRLVIARRLDERVTVAQFAEITGLDAGRAAARPGCPPAGDDGRRALGDLVAWHNASPGPEPALAVTPLGARELVTVTAFARLVERDPKTVRQYQGTPDFPGARDGKRYLLGQMARWWNGRGLKPGPVPAAR